MDLVQRPVQVDSLTLIGGKLSTWLEPNGSLNLMQLAAPTVPASAPPAAPPRATAPPPAPARAGSAAPWKFDLGEFELRDGSISAEDRSVRPRRRCCSRRFP